MLPHRHGDDAELHAARRADEPADAGDEAGCRAWKQILAALDEPRRTRPERPGTDAAPAAPSQAVLAPG